MHGSNINWLNVPSVRDETLPDNIILLLWLKPKVGAYLSFDCVSSRKYSYRTMSPRQWLMECLVLISFTNKSV